MNRKKLIGLFFRYVLPTMLAMFISGAYQLIDGIFIGNFVGRDALAAVNIGWSYITILLGFGLMVGIGIGSQYSLAMGREEESLALEYLGQAPAILLTFGLLFALLLIGSVDWLVSLPKANGIATENARRFVIIFALFSPFVMGSLAMPFIVRNVATPLLATLYMTIGVSVNIGLSYLLIVLLKKGVVGAAFASVIGESVAMVLGGYYLIRRGRRAGDFARNIPPLKWHHLTPQWRLIGRIFLNGSSAFFLYIYVGVMILLYHIQLEIYGGTLAISTYTIIGYLITVYYFAVEGVANGVQPLMSTLYGAKRTHILRFMVRLTLITGIGLGVFITLMLQLFPAYFSSLFIDDDPELLAASIHAIRFALPLLFLEGFFVIATLFFQSIGEGQKALLISIGNLLFQVPILFLLPKWIGLDGVWLTIPIAAVLLIIPVFYLFIRRYRKICF